MKVHISLVGMQPAPVYHGIVASQPDKVLLVYSDDTEKVLQRIVNILTNDVETILLHPTDPFEIYDMANALAEKYRNDNVSVNISSGLKSWSHLFGIVFHAMPNAHVIYMDQNNILWDYRTMQSRDDYKFDMDILFNLYGNPLVDYKAFADYTEQDYSALKQIESIRTYNFKTFNELVAVLNREQEHRLRSDPYGQFVASDRMSYVEWDRQGHWVRIALNKNRCGMKEVVIDSPNSMGLVFHSGWFEYKVATMLSRWKNAYEIRLNCVFPLNPDGQKGNHTVKNEVDIVVNTGRKMLFVECKTNISNSTDIDKFRTAVNNYGGKGSKALFITDNKMTPLQITKCRESNIIHFSLSQECGNVEQALFGLLDQELLSINA